MALKKRVSIVSDRIRVAYEGIDVDDAALDELAFDSNAAAAGLSISGQYVQSNREGPRSNTHLNTIIFAEQPHGRSFARPPIFQMGYVDSSNRRFIFPFAYMANEYTGGPGNADDWPRAVVTNTRAFIRNYTMINSYPGALGIPGFGPVFGTQNRAIQLHTHMVSMLIRWRALA